jgi:hypothetical protein
MPNWIYGYLTGRYLPTKVNTLINITTSLRAKKYPVPQNQVSPLSMVELNRYNIFRQAKVSRAIQKDSAELSQRVSYRIFRFPPVLAHLTHFRAYRRRSFPYNIVISAKESDKYTSQSSLTIYAHGRVGAIILMILFNL